MCSRTRETISDVLIYPRESQPRCLTGRDVSVDLEPGLRTVAMLSLAVAVLD